MRIHRLHAKHILIADDEAVGAGMLTAALLDAGCIPLGPFSALGEATSAVNRQTVDAAIVGLRLGDTLTFPLIRLIDALGIPVLVLADQIPAIVPADLVGIGFCQRPSTAGDVLHLLARTIELAGSTLRTGGTGGEPRQRGAQTLQKPSPAPAKSEGAVVTTAVFAPIKPPA